METNEQVKMQRKQSQVWTIVNDYKASIEAIKSQRV